jgi:hypothetical protein
MKLDNILKNITLAAEKTTEPEVRTLLVHAIEEITNHLEKERERVKRYRERKLSGEHTPARPAHVHSIDEESMTCTVCGKTTKDLLDEHIKQHKISTVPTTDMSMFELPEKYRKTPSKPKPKIVKYDSVEDDLDLSSTSDTLEFDSSLILESELLD